MIENMTNANKRNTFIFSVCAMIASCNQGGSSNTVNNKDTTITERFYVEQENSIDSTTANDIPPNGKYRFDMAFAEWQGQSMGEKVTVIINDEYIKVIYEGDGQLTQSKKSDVFEEGIIMKHKSGVWIIGKHPSDTQLDEIGGCTGGPAIIDFKNKKYWTC